LTVLATPFDFRQNKKTNNQYINYLVLTIKQSTINLHPSPITAIITTAASFGVVILAILLGNERGDLSAMTSEENTMIGDNEQNTNSARLPAIDTTGSIAKSDLMSRLSSFLPQIRAANIDLAKAQDQSMLQIDQNLLCNSDDEVDDNDTDSDSDDDDDENDTCIIEEKDEIVHISSPQKRMKCEESTKPTTIVMDIHMNQDINHPLFQALVDKPSENNIKNADDDKPTNSLDTDRTDGDHGVKLPNLILPRNVQKPTLVSRDGSSTLIQEIDDH
jgi:hypothetical protein